MRLCHRAGHTVPLLTIFTIFAGCATSTVPQPPNFNQSPQVVAIYAVDSAYGTFAPAVGAVADVLIFSTNPADSGRVSTNPPASYGGYRVEFDQPVNGATVANNADRATAIGGAASFCSPLRPAPNSPVQLLDLAAGTPAPITSSICYDATSALGSHPHILIIPGDPTATAALTCNQFHANQGSGPGGNVLAPNHRYGIQVKSDIQNANNKPLAAPTGAGWVGDTFTFTTSGLKILAAGYIDANTGFFVWLDKPEIGFEKDLAATSSTFQQPTDGSPFIVVLSEPVTAAGTAGDNDLTGVVTLTRGDATVPEFFAQTASDLLGDPRVIEIYLGTGDVNNGNTPAPFEPGTGYRLTIPAAIASDVGAADTLGTAKTYAFQTALGSPANVGITPSNGAQAQPFATTNPATPSGTNPEIDFSVPIVATGTTPGGTFKLTGPNGDVPVTALVGVNADVGVVHHANNQIVTLTPSTPLVPESNYTISYTGVKAAAPAAVANALVPDDSVQFTTATFRMARISPTATSATNLDRQTTVDPVTVLKANKLTAVFNNTTAPAGVNASTLVLAELNGTAATPIATTATNPSPTAFTFAIPGYQPKYGQKYEVRAATSITDPVSTKALKAEGCTTGDCADVKSFTTRKVGVKIAPDPGAATATGFLVTFTDPIDGPSLTPFLTTATKPGEFKLFARDATGALNTTPTPINCSIVDSTHVKCTAAAPLGNSPNAFVASAVFLPTATTDPAAGGPSGPAIVAPATSTDASARFSGNASATIFAPCAGP